MKIVYCLSSTCNPGGIERIVIDKANYLAEKGHKVYLITTEQSGREPFYKIHPSIRLIDLDINYSFENNQLWKKATSFYVKNHRHKKRLQALLGELSPDVTVSTFGNEVRFLHGFSVGGKKVLEIHFSKNFRLQAGRKGMWRIIDEIRTRTDERLVKKYDTFVVLTYEDKQIWGDLKNMVVIPNFVKNIPEVKCDLAAKKVIAVGRLTFQKGLDRLINIWATVFQSYPDWHLELYGRGEEKNALLQQIQQLGLSKSVTIHEPVSDVSRVYTSASIYVMTSRYEGFPMVLLEAMSYGLPIVSYKCQCGPRDLISNGKDGFLVEEGDAQGFVEKLVELMNDEELRKSVSLKTEEKINGFTRMRIMSKWEALFERLTI